LPNVRIFHESRLSSLSSAVVRPNRNLGRSGGKVEGSLESLGRHRRYLDVLSPLGLYLS
jgi:hypothetical protein